MFQTSELSRLAVERAAVPAFDPIAGRGRSESPSAFMADGFFSAFEDPLVPAREPGPGDSNYELTLTLQHAEGDSGSEWDAEPRDLHPEAPSSDEIPALGLAAAASGPESWPHYFIDTWGLRLIVASLVLIGALIPTIAYLIWRILVSGPPSEFPASTLIAGFACAVALLMIAVPLLLLAASLTQLVRDFRQLCQRSERGSLTGRR